MVLAAPLAAAYGITPRPATPDRTLWIINNTTVSSKVVTFRKGINPPAFRADIGDLNLTLAASTTYYIPSPDPSRFEQADGSINVDFAAGMTGTIAVVGLPQASFYGTEGSRHDGPI